MSDRETLKRYVRNNPHASPMSAVAQTGLNPDEWLPVAEDLVAADRAGEQDGGDATPEESTDTDDASDSAESERSTETGEDTGTACFADADKFVDQSEGGAIKAAAVACVYVRVTESPRGEDFRNAVAKLRSWGFDVPLLERGRGAKATSEELGLDEEPEDEDDELEQFASALEADRRDVL